MNINIVKNFTPSTIANSIKKLREFRKKERKGLFVNVEIESYDVNVFRCLDCLKQTLEFQVKLYKESLHNTH